MNLAVAKYDANTMKMSQKFAQIIDDLLKTRGTHEAEYNFVHRFPSEKTLIVDVGSNIGNSVVSFSNVLPNVKICGFEPNILLKDYLTRAQQINPNFSYSPVAIGSAPGKFTLYIPVVDNVIIAGESSLDLNHFNNPIVANRLKGYSGSKTFSLTSIDCVVETLDQQVHLFKAAQMVEKRVIKIDVEGSEFAVLQGGVKFITQFRPNIMVEEGHRADITGFLASYGYSRYLYSVESKTLVEAANRVALNSIFVWRAN